MSFCEILGQASYKSGLLSSCRFLMLTESVNSGASQSLFSFLYCATSTPEPLSSTFV